jgi:hypothetical protein
MFSQQRLDVSKILNIMQSYVFEETGYLPYIVDPMDDTGIKKGGKVIQAPHGERIYLGHISRPFSY